jgi:hypothetical protein
MDGGLLSTYPLLWFLRFLQQDFGLGQSRSLLFRALNRRGIGFWERPIYRTHATEHEPWSKEEKPQKKKKEEAASLSISQQDKYCC